MFSCMCILLLFLFEQKVFTQTEFDLEGHRGCRGLMPENTIPAMREALILGVNTLEMDVIISKDNQIVVSHDPFFESDFCLTPEGHEIFKEEEKQYNMYQMNYEEIRQYDVGSKIHPGFPQQKKLKTYRPLLSELIDSVEKYATVHNLKAPFYNIEIKSSKSTDSNCHPVPEEYVQLVMDVLLKKGIYKRVTIQSFDERPLKIIHKDYPEMKTAWLVANFRSVHSNLKKLGFIPDIYSPYYKMVNKNTVNNCHKHNVEVIPWTVNDIKKMNHLIKIGVDGLITDYPQLYFKR